MNHGHDTAEEKAEHVPLLKKLGPGLITGAADDDPSGIARYSQASAQYGYGLLWSVLFTTPLMISIQTSVQAAEALRPLTGEFVIRRKLKLLGWLATMVMAVALVAMFALM